MNRQEKETSLTAAECASRTGLTVRALRVYEELGLIAPKRSIGGWRYYGADDLIRLNTITMLKVAGLTLSQIKAVTNLNDKDPSLQHVLEVQIDTWKSKQAAAARGQAVTEAALKNLRTHDSLSLDELCDLVRNMEMSEQIAAATTERDAFEVKVSIAVLDRYVGYYEYGGFATLAITREGEQLFGERTGMPRHTLVAQSETEFFSPSSNANGRFNVDAHGNVIEFVIHQAGIRICLPRIDTQVAVEIGERLATKIASQKATPGSDIALRRLLDCARSGEPNYKEMSPLLASTLHQQLPILEAMGKYLGEIRSLDFRGVNKQGMDVFDVLCEHGASQWRIGVRSDGIVENASTVGAANLLDAFTPKQNDVAISELGAQTPTPGSEAALRRMIDGIRAGNPNYDEMSPLLAFTIRQQLPQLQSLGKQLGALIDIVHKGVVVQRFDIYDIKRENGSARWRICMGADGTVTNANAMVTESSVTGGI